MADIGHNGPPPEAGPYAIYRTAKLKTHSQIVASALHMTRERDTPNADPRRAHLNEILIGGEDPSADVMALLPSLGQRDPETGKILRRSNSVLAIEILITTSPEWFHDATPEMIADWKSKSLQWLKDEYGEENVAHVRLHADETTPHITGYIVPRDPITGSLNCRRWIGERSQLRDQQTAYAASVEHLGLQRGVRGSTAAHEAVKRVYGAISADQQPVRVPKPSRLTVSPDEWAAEAQKQMLEDLEPTFARAANADKSRTEAKAARAQARKDRGRAERAEKDRDNQRAVADRLRALPIADVLDKLGFERDRKNPLKWKAEGFVISAGTGDKAGKWFDHLNEYGRGGSIDLVSHVMGTDFKGSLAWLAGAFGESAAMNDLTAQRRREARAEVNAAVKEREPFTPPAPIPENWPKVRTWLIEERKLPAGYIDQMHVRGDIYADDKKNAVFLARDPETEKVTGAELKGTFTRSDGTKFSGMALGSKKELGGFRLGAVAKAKLIYLVESAIDAISLYRLRFEKGERDFAVISTAGVRKPDTLPTFIQKLKLGVKRVCAWDNDKVGDTAAKKLGWERLKPEHKDWNDDLKAKALMSDTTTTNTTHDADDTPSPS